jgi:ethanolamine utilization protein EutA
VINVDIGGGTSKIAVCRSGEIVDRTAADIGARIVAFDGDRRIRRIEVAGRWFGERLGRTLSLGDELPTDFAAAMAEDMADQLLAIMRGRASADAQSLLRLEPLGVHSPDAVTISGGVAEYAYGKSQTSFGDLGPLLAAAFVSRLAREGLQLKQPDELIRATVIGAAQYTAQVSGGTIFVSPLDILPLRNVPVIAPAFPLEETIDPASVARATTDALRFMELEHADSPVAIFVSWRGSASFARLDAFCRGLLDALGPATMRRRRPLVLVGDHDVGGLIGIHLRHELGFEAPLASIDGLELKSFDYVDIGEMLDASGAVPVVIKSLVFPSDARIGHSQASGAELQPSTKS